MNSQKHGLPTAVLLIGAVYAIALVAAPNTGLSAQQHRGEHAGQHEAVACGPQGSLTTAQPAADRPGAVQEPAFLRRSGAC